MKEFNRQPGHQNHANFVRAIESRDELMAEQDLAIIRTTPKKPAKPTVRKERPANNSLPKGERDEQESTRFRYNFTDMDYLTPEETIIIIEQRMREQAERFLELTRERRLTPPWRKFAKNNPQLIKEVRQEEVRKMLGKH